MTEDRTERIILDTNEFDVLLGRGNNVNYRSGNVCFRNLAAERALEYTNTDKKERKDELAQEIISSVKKKGGRFLRSVTVSNAKGDHIAAWELVDSDVVMTKAKQAMRDAASSMNKSKRENETTSSNHPGFERPQTLEHAGVFSRPQQGEANVNMYLGQPTMQQSLGTATHPDHLHRLGPSVLHRFNVGEIGQPSHFPNFGGSNDYLTLMLQHRQREEMAHLQRQYIQSQLSSNLYPHGMIGSINAERNARTEMPIPDPAAPMRSQMLQSLPESNPGSTIAKRMRDSVDSRSSESNTADSKRSRTMDQSSFYEQSKSTTTAGGSSRQSLYPKHPMSLPLEPYSLTHLHAMATADQPLLHPAEQRRTSDQGIAINQGSLRPVYQRKSSEESSSSDGSQKKPKAKP